MAELIRMCPSCGGRGHYPTPRLRFPETPEPDPINGPCRTCNGTGANPDFNVPSRPLADECIEAVDVECTRWNACTDCYTGTEHRPVRVVVTDDATGEELGVQVVHNDYLLICAGNRYLSHVQRHANGTTVLTVRQEGPRG